MGTRSRFNDIILTVRNGRSEQDLAIAEEVITNDCYRLRTLKACRRRLDVIVDIGGHIGSFGLFAKSLWPEATLIAVEPNPESAALYRANLEANGFDDDIVITAALNYSSSRRTLVGDGRSTGGCMLVDAFSAKELALAPDDQNRYNVVAENVAALTLEQILDRFGVERIDLLKLDCEGSEQDLCLNVCHKESLRVDVMLGEYHNSGGFENFARDARRAFPQLYLFGDSEAPIGPFWGFPSFGLATGFFLVHQFKRLQRLLTGDGERVSIASVKQVERPMFEMLERVNARSTF